MIKVCETIEISEIELLNVSGTERVKKRNHSKPLKLVIELLFK